MDKNYFKRGSYLNLPGCVHDNYQKKKTSPKKIIKYSGIFLGSVGLLVALTPLKWALIGGLSAILFPGACNKEKSPGKNIEKKVIQEQIPKENSDPHAYYFADSLVHANPI